MSKHYPKRKKDSELCKPSQLGCPTWATKLRKRHELERRRCAVLVLGELTVAHIAWTGTIHIIIWSTKPAAKSSRPLPVLCIINNGKSSKSLEADQRRKLIIIDS
jgi:hypothetical protein